MLASSDTPKKYSQNDASTFLRLLARYASRFKKRVTFLLRMLACNALVLFASASFLSANDLSLLSLTRECVGCDLSNRDMTRIDLSETKLENVDFRNSVLTDSDFSGSEIRRTNFSEAKLQRANFHGTRLRNTDPQGKFSFEMSGVDFRGAGFESAIVVILLRESKLSGANFSSSLLNIKGDLITATGANFSQSLGYGLFEGAFNVRNSEFQRADFSDSKLRSSKFLKSNLQDANFQNADLSESNFSDSDLSRANFQNADLSNVDFSGSNLSRANLEGADLSGADLKDAILCEAVSPDGKILFIGCE